MLSNSSWTAEVTDETATAANGESSDQIRRGGCLTVFLLFMIATNALSAVSYLLRPEPALQQFPRLSKPLVLILVAGCLLNVLLAVLVWHWNRVGVHGFLAVSVLAFAVNLYIGLPVPFLAIGLIGPVILVLLVRSRWRRFS